MNIKRWKIKRGSGTLKGCVETFSYFWLAGNEGNKQKMRTNMLLGLTPSFPANQRQDKELPQVLYETDSRVFEWCFEVLCWNPNP